MRINWSIIRDLIEATIVLLVIVSVCGVCVFSAAWAAAQVIRWLFSL